MGLIKRKLKRANGTKYTAWYGHLMFSTDEKYPNGKSKYKHQYFILGHCDKVTKKEAEEAYIEARKTILREAAEDDSPQTTLYRFGEREYIPYKRDTLKLRSWKRDVYSLRNLYRILGADTILEDIKPNDLIAYQHKRLGEVASNAAVNREMACLRSLINLAKLKGKYRGDNPVSQIRQLEEHNRERILTRAEEKRLLKHSPPYLGDIIICALHTGMRQAEIYGLQWKDVDLKRDVITVAAASSKTKRQKKIPVNSVLKEVLKRLRSNGSDYVFLSPLNQPYSGPGGTKRAFATACRQAGITGLRFHDLRHTAATRMIEANVNIVTAGRILGHASVKTTERYLHPDESLRKATAALAKT